MHSSDRYLFLISFLDYPEVSLSKEELTAVRILIEFFLIKIKRSEQKINISPNVNLLDEKGIESLN